MAKKDSRVLFLKEFTKELILNSRKPKEFFPHHPVKLAVPEKPVQAPSTLLNAPLIIPRTMEMEKVQPFSPARLIIPQPLIPQAPLSPASLITPSPQPLPPNFSLEKLDQFILDNKITSIECQGPGKPILVKILGKVNSTQVMLSEEEIRKIIEIFSTTAKIPLIGGVFKAAVGNLVITAVISDFVGSRFIINKYTPYSILEQAPQSQFQPQNQQFSTK